MRRPVRRSRAIRLEIRGECGARDGAKAEKKRVPPPPAQKSHNNYLAQSAETGSSTKGTGKVALPGVSSAGAVAKAEAQRRRGAPFGNRNAVRPELAELRAHKAKVAAIVARAKAAIAAANAIMAARPRRRIDCITYMKNGVVMRVCARVRVKAKRPDFCPRAQDGLVTGTQSAGEVLSGARRRGLTRTPLTSPLPGLRPDFPRGLRADIETADARGGRKLLYPLPFDRAAQAIDVALQAVQLRVEGERPAVGLEGSGLVAIVFQHLAKLEQGFELARVEVDHLLQRDHRGAVFARVLLHQSAVVPALGKAGGKSGDLIEEVAGHRLLTGRQGGIGPPHQQIDGRRSRAQKRRQDLSFEGFGIFRRLGAVELREQLIHRRRRGRHCARRSQRQTQKEDDNGKSHGTSLTHRGSGRVARITALWPGINPGAP